MMPYSKVLFLKFPPDANGKYLLMYTPGSNFQNAHDMAAENNVHELLSCVIANNTGSREKFYNDIPWSVIF